MTRTSLEPIIFLFDVDNTLLDNDAVNEDLRGYLKRELGEERHARYWSHYEDLRRELGYSDYLGALQRYRLQFPHDTHILKVSSYLINYPFGDRVFPGAFESLDHCRRWGPVVILSDGDVVFQPHKIERSGLAKAVDGQVLIYIHKEHELDDIERRHPAARYVFVDDKPRLVHAVKQRWKDRVQVTFVNQGHYARDPEHQHLASAADRRIERIGDLLNLDFSEPAGP